MRYEAGETLASIARTYSCSPPAISYILSRSKERDATPESTEQSVIGAGQPQLVKEYANEIPPVGAPEGETKLEEIAAHAGEPPASQEVEGLHREPPDERGHVPASATDAFGRGAETVVHEAEGHAAAQGRPNRTVNGTSPGTPGSAGALSQNSEPRRTLHLSLSQDDTHPPNQPPRDAAGATAPERSVAPVPGGHQHGLPLPPSQPSPSLDASAATGEVIRKAPEPHGAKDGGAFIDQALRARVEGDITAFLAAFDAALAHDTLESRTGLREATDRLLRAGARTRIELERLEARIPLPVRYNDGRPAQTWRPR